MPIYEYRCNACRRRASVFVRSVSSPVTPACACGSKDMSRIFSRFAVHQGKGSYKDVYDDILNDRQLTSGLERNDPRALGEWSRKMSRAAGEDTTPETEELMDRMKAGEDLSTLQKEYLEQTQTPSGPQHEEKSE